MAVLPTKTTDKKAGKDKFDFFHLLQSLWCRVNHNEK